MTTVMMMMFVPLLLLPFISCVTETRDPRENAEKESWEKLLFYHRPTFKMIRRQVRNFRVGHVGTLTLVFRSSTHFDIRWFRHAPDLYLVNSEVPNKISVEGDPSYKLTTMKSGDVTCTKLSSIIDPKHRTSDYAEFVTVFTSQDGSIQYQISSRIKIKQHGGTHVDPVDGPDWLITPPKINFLEFGKNLTIHCALLMSKESRSFTDELSLMKEIKSVIEPHFVFPPEVRHSRLKFDFTKVVSIHKDTPNKVETQGESLLIGRRHKLWLLDSPEVIYELNLTSPFNLTHAGKYLCTFDRNYDRLYYLTQVVIVPSPKVGAEESIEEDVYTRSIRYKQGSMQDKLKPWNVSLAVELLSCRGDNYANDVLILYRGMPTCVRCRAQGGAGLKLGVYRYGVELEKMFSKKYQDDRTSSIRKRNTDLSRKHGDDDDDDDGGGGGDDDHLRRSDWNYKLAKIRKTKRHIRVRTNRGPVKQGNDLALITNKHVRQRDEDDSRDLRGHSRFPPKDIWTSAAQVGVSRFIHVADGGIHEVAFTFHRPQPSLLPPGDGYSCKAADGGMEKEIKFKIEFAH